MDNNQSTSGDAVKFESKSKLTVEEKKLLNEKVDDLFSKLHLALLKQNKHQIKHIIVQLEKCEEKLKSTFLNDIIFIIKYALKNTNKGDQDGSTNEW